MITVDFITEFFMFPVCTLFFILAMIYSSDVQTYQPYTTQEQTHHIHIKQKQIKALKTS